jgi:hypothetical protein
MKLSIKCKKLSSNVISPLPHDEAEAFQAAG